jgi:hypothetical protein
MSPEIALPTTVIDAALLSMIPMWWWSTITLFETPIVVVLCFMLMIENPRLNIALAITRQQIIRMYIGRFGCVTLSAGALMIMLTQALTHSTRPSAAIVIAGMLMIILSLVLFIYEAADIETEVLGAVQKAAMPTGITVSELFGHIKIPDRSIGAVGLAIERLEAKGRLERYWDPATATALYRVPR